LELADVVLDAEILRKELTVVVLERLMVVVASVDTAGCSPGSEVETSLRRVEVHGWHCRKLPDIEQHRLDSSVLLKKQCLGMDSSADRW
jgi:hypothetical protein